MLINQVITEIITDGTHAPSGENCQPWRFVVKGSEIHIYDLPDADTSIYNHGKRGSHIAHGALIETLSLSAAKHGYQAAVSVFPDAKDKDLVAVIALSPGEVPADTTLYDAIVRRSTNRKEYTGEKLTSVQREALQSLSTPTVTVHLYDDASQLKEIGQAVAMNEKVIFANRSLHDFFYGHIIWDESKKDEQGFYYKSLEFTSAQLPAVKMFKNWGALAFLSKFMNVAEKIAGENAAKYSRSGTIAILTTQHDTPADLIEAGRVTQRFWLTATAHAIAVQPCTGLIYFAKRNEEEMREVFSMTQIKEIRSQFSVLEKTTKLAGQHMAMLMRVGFADAPSGVAGRMTPRIEFVGA